MNETAMRAPAVGAGNGGNLFEHAGGCEGAPDVEVVIVKVAHDAAHFAGAEAAVVIDDDGGFAGRAGHGPGLGRFEAGFVKIEMKAEIAQVVDARCLARSDGQMLE